MAGDSGSEVFLQNKRISLKKHRDSVWGGYSPPLQVLCKSFLDQGSEILSMYFFGISD